MIKFLRIVLTSFVLVSASLPASGQNQAGGIPAAEITGLDAKLAKAGESASAARKKLAIRRVIREAEALIKKHPTASNRYEALGVLFRSQQALVSLDNSTANRKAFLETSKKLAAAPNEYAALRLDADLLLTQAESARKGADSHARSDALRPLVERYRDTDVEPKVIRIAMIMALELGNTKLVNDLRKVVAERFPGNMDLINFQREKLAGQVFGAPFIGGFERSDGTMARFPLDFLGTTTAIYCWSKEGDGLEDLKALAADWKKAKVEHNAAGRFQFVSMNMDDLPDAGEGILREHGLDWQALKMPKGQENPIYQTYVKRDTPTIVIVSPNGYVALYQSGGRSNRTYERRLQSMLASQWAQSHNTSLLQSVYSGEFLVMQPDGDFDPAAPPELKAIKQAPISGSIPGDELRAIQSCFIEPPLRFSTPQNQIIANYEKANSLCLAAIAAHPKAPDLWIVRNRRITALMGLWKTRADQKAFASAVTEAKAAIESGYPRGTDVVAQLCLARQALRAPDAKPKEIIESFVKSAGGKEASAPALLAASLLALDTGDRRLHDQYRQTFLGKYATDPTMWTATSFLLDRYLRYWLYHPPYTAGWTYGRRQGHFLAIGTPEEALRTIQTELKTLEGETVKIPESSDGKWTVISFVPTAAGNGYLKRYAAFVSARPFQDTKLIVAVLDDDAESADKLLKEKAAELEKRRQQPDTFPTLLVPGGLKNPIVRQLGMVTDEEKPKNNILLIRPDGSIAVAMSGLAMSAQKGSVIQNVIEFHDEELVDKALAKGDLDEAKRLAFAHAPVEQVRPEDAPRNWKPKVLTVPHLRSRAKVYLAMGELKAAQADIQEVYLKVNTAAGYISMRTKELEETEALKASILTALEKAE
ncbi:thioredoxin family protein [Akkermansiaceae bacterium]|nr:thioredoxin family protein [Akkermansiaceae bacterium]MDB2429293.1 thioredoxin family protein [Akkermansiaceae bacterium]MDB4576670.1 thioredoxin family protein [Akkermansiaceae bacterium]